MIYVLELSASSALRLILALFLITAASNANAASYSDQGLAYAGCLDHASRANGNPNIGSSFKPLVCDLYSTTGYCVARKGGNGCVGTSTEYGYQGEHTFPANATCSSRPEETSWKGDKSGIGAVCHNGCKYTDSLYAGSPTGHLYTPSGDTCNANELAPPEIADPGEGGGDGGGTGPGDGGGDGGGTDPGGGDGGGGTGPGGGDGGGGTGPGDGDGDGGGTDPGGGTGPGPGPGTGEGGDGGGAGPTTGRLYKKSGKTVAKVLAEFKAGIEGAPILSKVKGFFGTCTGGGSCPTATWDGGQYAGKFDLASLCSGPLLQLFQYAGFVFLAGMGVVALRWALL